MAKDILDKFNKFERKINDFLSKGISVSLALAKIADENEFGIYDIGISIDSISCFKQMKSISCSSIGFTDAYRIATNEGFHYGGYDNSKFEKSKTRFYAIRSPGVSAYTSFKIKIKEKEGDRR